MRAALDLDLQRILDGLVLKLKYRKIAGSFKCAEETLLFFRILCNRAKWTRAKELMELVKSSGKVLVAASPYEVSIGNIVRRILHVIREEYTTEVADDLVDDHPGTNSSGSTISLVGHADESRRNSVRNGDGGSHSNIPSSPVSESTRVSVSLSKSLTHYAYDQGTVSKDREYEEARFNLKASVVEGISELLNEFELSRDNILQFAQDTIHSNEIILTIAHSHTVEKFLIEASGKRRFQVIVVEGGAKLDDCHRFAKKLSESHIQTTILTYAAIFAIMSKVTKVIIGAHAVLADGGAIVTAGCQALALSAKHYRVPLIVCAGIYRLSPVYPCSYDQDEFQNMLSPHQNTQNNTNNNHTTIIAPSYDYIDSSLISIFITNAGGNAPSYVYRLISEYYHPDDYIL